MPRGLLVAALLSLIGLTGAAPARAQGAVRTWTVGVSLRQVHSSNLFPYLVNGPSDILETPTVSVTYGRSTPVGSVSASLQGWGTFFHEQTQFNRMGTIFVLGGSRQVSRRASLSLSAAALNGYSGESLYAARLFFPQVDVASKQGAARLSIEMTPKTTAAIDVNGSTSAFTVGIPIGGAQITADPSLVQPVPFPGLSEPPLPGAPRALDLSLLAISILSSEGLLAGHSDLSLFGGGIALTHSFSPGVSATAWLRYNRVNLSNVTVTTQDGGRTDASVALTRVFNPSTRLTLSYTDSQNRAQVPTFSSRSFLVQGEKGINEHLKVEGSLGYSALDSSAGGIGGTLLGGGGFSGQAGRTRISVRYHRTPFVAYGLGRNEVTDYGSVSLSRTLSERLGGWVDAGYRQSSDPLDPSFQLSTRSFGAGLGYRFRERTQLGADYSRLRWTDLTTTVPIDTYVWSLFISYGKAFR